MSYYKQWGGFNKKKAGRLFDGKEWSQSPMNELVDSARNLKLDGVVKSPIYGVVAIFKALGIPHVWPRI